MEYTCESREDTVRLGEALAGTLRPGDVVALSGPMGAGKTAFCGGIARGLGIREPVTSPTYTIVNEYPGPIPLFHFDLYRLRGPEDLFDIGFEDYLDRDGICVLEWPEVAGGELKATVFVDITITGDERRTISITRGECNADSGV